MNRQTTFIAALALSASLMGPALALAAGVQLHFDREHPDETPFPSDLFTVPDRRQNIGLRVALPVPDAREQPSNRELIRIDEHTENNDGDNVAKPFRPAETVLLNGNVYTMKKRKRADCVAIEDGRIIYVGRNRKCTRFIDNSTRVIDLEGQMVLPAFVDSHMHPTSAYETLFHADLTQADTHEEIIAAVTEFARANPEKEWIIGNGFPHSLYGDTGPVKETLDAIDSIRPIVLYSASGHSIWVNSRALEIAEITKDTPSPEFGVIQKDPETGEPTGFLKENAVGLVVWRIPKPQKEDMKTAILELQTLLSSQGITTVHDASMHPYDPLNYEIYDELAKQGLLNMRIRGSWGVGLAGMQIEDTLAIIDKEIALAEQFTHPHFKTHSFKFFADGTISDQTAYLLEPYAFDPEYRGRKAWEDEAAFEAMRKVDAAGYQIHVHTNGDGAVQNTLDILEAVLEANGMRDARHSFAHVQMASYEDIIRMSLMDISAHMSPYWHVIDDYYWNVRLPFLGEERANSMFRHNSLFEAGVNVACASDFNISWPDMMDAIYKGMYRVMPERVYQELYGDSPYHQHITDPEAPLEFNDIGVLPSLDERVSLESMLRSATINGAYANFLENDIGTIETGKLADLVIIDTDLFSVENPEQIAEAQIMLTFFEGRIVYDANKELNDGAQSLTRKTAQ